MLGAKHLQQLRPGDEEREHDGRSLLFYSFSNSDRESEG